ncbi:hypothetical protein CPC08DRAFT_494124 [Agrocybe pediades]|nr:hypothetical protein CPC08DRAFT_494124 [Agrocybe pediades]
MGGHPPSPEHHPITQSFAGGVLESNTVAPQGLVSVQEGYSKGEAGPLAQTSPKEFQPVLLAAAPPDSRSRSTPVRDSALAAQPTPWGCLKENIASFCSRNLTSPR